MENISNHLSSRVNRVLAYLIDMLPITLIIILIFYNFLGFDEVLASYQNRGEDIAPRIDFLQQRNQIRDISFLVWIVYSIIMDCSKEQGSFGKQMIGIKVVDYQGERLTLKKSVIRNLGKALSYIIVFIGFLWILFDKNKQGLHDKIAKTYVVDKDISSERQI